MRASFEGLFIQKPSWVKQTLFCILLLGSSKTFRRPAPSSYWRCMYARFFFRLSISEFTLGLTLSGDKWKSTLSTSRLTESQSPRRFHRVREFDWRFRPLLSIRGRFSDLVVSWFSIWHDLSIVHYNKVGRQDWSPLGITIVSHCWFPLSSILTMSLSLSTLLFRNQRWRFVMTASFSLWIPRVLRPWPYCCISEHISDSWEGKNH